MGLSTLFLMLNSYIWSNEKKKVQFIYMQFLTILAYCRD